MSSALEVFKPDLMDGRTVFITGGGSGIGRGICDMLGGLGARIFIASRNSEKLGAAAPPIVRRQLRTCLMRPLPRSYEYA